MVLPLYYAVPRAERAIARATEAGTGAVETTVRPLSGADDRRVTLAQGEPSALFPTVDGDDTRGGEGGNGGEDEREDEGAPPE